MNIKISYYGQSRQLAGKGDEQLDAEDNVTANAVLKILSEKYGEAFSTLVLSDEGVLRKSILLSVNDEITDPNQTLSDNDELSLYPALSGG